MQNKTVFWGIIGCGDVAEVKSGPGFQKANNSELVAVMRRDANKAKDFASRHQVPFWYSDASELLSNKKVNAVYIATPPSTHLNYALQVLEAGKDVYIEKPMVLSKAEAVVLAKAEAKSTNKLVVAHYRRYLPAFLKVKDLLDKKAIGDISFIDIKFLQPSKTDLISKSDDNWRINPEVSGGGYFHDIAPHQIDLMQYFFGEHIKATGFSSNQKGEYNADDAVNGIIEFENNIQFRGLWNFNILDKEQQDNCTIYGALGKIVFSFYGDEVTVTYPDENVTMNFENPLHVQQPLIQETVNYFLEKRDNPSDIKAGLGVAEIMDAFCKK